MKLSKLKTSLIGAAALAGALFTGAANAQTFEITGTATNFDTDAVSSFTATVSFEDSVSDDDSVPGQSAYDYSSLTFTLGTDVFNFAAAFANSVTVVDDEFFGDSVTVDANNDAFDSLFITGFGFDAFTGTALSNITNLGSLDVTGSSFTSGGGDFYELSNIRASAVSAVPEPATWLMMVLGFGLVGFARKRRMAVSAKLA